MKHKTYSWTQRDRKTIFANCWSPEKESDKTILFVHGLGDHSGRYNNWAEKFSTKGFNFFAVDLYGHGKSSGKRGHARSLDVLLDDIDLMFEKAGELFPGSRLVLYGHSMGGNLVLNHVIRRNRPVDAVIVTSPWLKMYREPSYALIVVASIARKFYPSLTVRTPLKAEQISHDRDVNSTYSNDPLVHNRISLQLFFELYNSGLYAMRNVYKINYPFLIMHGTADTITSPKASENYVMNTGKRTTLKLWEGQYHELHHEAVADEVFQYIIDWLQEYNL
jgi:alpha-beta hydrolase superfamily lysophospholipase